MKRPRSVEFEAATPRLYRELRIAALRDGAAVHAYDSTTALVVVNESRWAALLSAYEAREIVSDLHPAFVANVCGTLIQHPSHDGIAQQYAACPLCPIYFAKPLTAE